MGAVSPTHLIIVLVIVLLLFGAKRIPELARGLGTGMHEFRKGVSGEIEEDSSGEKDESYTDDTGSDGSGGPKRADRRE